MHTGYEIECSDCGDSRPSLVKTMFYIKKGIDNPRDYWRRLSLARKFLFFG